MPVLEIVAAALVGQFLLAVLVGRFLASRPDSLQLMRPAESPTPVRFDPAPDRRPQPSLQHAG